MEQKRESEVYILVRRLRELLCRIAFQLQQLLQLHMCATRKNEEQQGRTATSGY